ncbi:TonB-dependent receptor [Flavobacterium magnum]|uniref:TonB-dependent receptor n=1 Tax=Flavobacterium magnum TaxID=2162713 RepID=A0A2S0RD34_9FLAO|nr:TonB-dependent receptor [Flavobacterium magnum]AWA29847.1 TonB-dependent receptor [Flavobacterium magnum]
MKLKIALIFFVAGIFSMNAQNQGSVSGKVTDSQTNTPISYATIVIKADDKITTGGITDDNGNFEIKNLELKKYTVEIQFIGYKTYKTEITLSGDQKNVSLNRISLAEESTELEGVTVVQERSTVEQKIDRKVINVGRDLTTAGATASDIMGNIPSVNVDQDGKISLRGNQNVRVLVDGRPTNIDAAQLLKQIPSTSIKKIELITNPSAKYNPEGMSGIINIVLHKNANDGFNASLNTGVTFATTPKSNSSIDMNYRRGKVNFFGTYGNNFGYQFNNGDVTREDDNSSQLFDIMNDNKSHLYKIGMDFYIDDRNTISAYTNQNLFVGDGYIHTDNLFATPGMNFTSDDHYRNDNGNSTYNLAYKHLFAKEGHTLDVEANHNWSKDEQAAEFDRAGNTTAADYNDFKVQRRKNSTINVDYVNPLNEKTTLELGAESRTIRTDNDYFTTQPGELAYIKFLYDVDIYSAYATFGQRFQKFSYQLGARVESYKVEATNNGARAYEDDYFTLYPSAYLTYQLNEKNSLQWSYSRRVDRPSLEQTSPIREFSTVRFKSIGNPELDPQFTNSMEVNYTRMLEKGSISAGVFYRIINDEISRILIPDPDNTQNQIMLFDNFDNNKSFGFELSSNYKINKWWDIQPAIDFSSITQKGIVSIFNPAINDFESVQTEITANAFNARMNSNFKATKKLSFLLFGFYRGGVNGIQFNGKEMYKVDAGARYSFLKNKATMSVRFNDMFNTMRFAFEGDNPYPQHGQFTWESQSVYINFNFMFGAGKNRALQRKYREDNTKQGGGGLF